MGPLNTGPAVQGQSYFSARTSLCHKRFSLRTSAAVFGSDGLPSSLKIESFDQARVRLTFIGARKHTYSTIGVLTSGDAPVRNPYAGSGADPGKGLPGR